MDPQTVVTEKEALKEVFTAFDRMKVELKIDPATIEKKGMLSLLGMLMRNGDKIASICGPAFNKLNELYKLQQNEPTNPGRT